MSKKKMLMRKFGSVPPTNENNTFIGGVASIISTPALLADKFQYYPSGDAFNEADIHNFTIVGSDIECYIGVDYQIANNGFANNDLITYYEDAGNFCKHLGNYAFGATSGSYALDYKLNELKFNGCLSIGNYIGSYVKIKIFIFPLVTSIPDLAFYNNGSTTEDYDLFYFPLSTTIGSTVGSTNVFPAFSKGISAKTRLYLNPSLQTCNGGLPDGDLNYAISVGAYISYVINFTAPNPKTDLSIGTVYCTALQLNFTEPTGSTNAIDFYEVWVNGKYNNTITGSGGYAVGLSLNTSYQIEVKPIDIYYNKSTSNIVTQTTASTLVYQDYLVSYYKMENNVFDSWGANNGTATAITYESGLVGQRAVFNGTTSKIITANNASLQLSNGSISVIVKASAAGSSYRGIVVKKLAYSLFLVDGVLGTYSWGGTAGFRTTGINLNDGLDHIVVMTFQSGVTNGTKIYLDNVLVLTTTITVSAQTQGITIGAGDTVGSQWINAKIDEPAIFNTILSVSDISDINAKLLSGQSLI